MFVSIYAIVHVGRCPRSAPPQHTFQKRTVTSEFAECNFSLSVRLSFHFLTLIPLESPCAEAFNASLDCLNRRNYDRDKFLNFFQAYRDCKKAWARPIILIPTSHMPIAPRDWNNARQIAARGGHKWRYACEGHEYPKNATTVLFMYEANHSSLGRILPSRLLIRSPGPRAKPARPENSIDDMHDSEHLFLSPRLTDNLHAHG